MTNSDATSDIFVLNVKDISPNVLVEYQTYRNDFYEIDLVTKQYFFEFTIDGVTYRPNGKPFICFVSPNQLQTYKELGIDYEAEGFLIYIKKTVLENSLFQSIKLPFFKREFESYYEISEFNYSQLFFWANQLFLESALNQPYKSITIKNLLSIFLVKSLELIGSQKSIISSKPEQITDKYLDLIKEHLKIAKTVTFYAEALAVSSKTLNEICKITLGKNALQIIHEQITSEAIHQLSFTSESIKEISFSLGFNEVSGFSRWFKKQVGVSPENFRASSQIDKSI
ncbi:helix-turn-helix domain-containing protein [Belliella marina]